MRKLMSSEVVELLDDSKIIVRINDKKFIRTIKKSIDDRSYIVVNFQEFEV